MAKIPFLGKEKEGTFNFTKNKAMLVRGFYYYCEIIAVFSPKCYLA